MVRNSYWICFETFAETECLSKHFITRLISSVNNYCIAFRHRIYCAQTLFTDKHLYDVWRKYFQRKVNFILKNLFRDMALKIQFIHIFLWLLNPSNIKIVWSGDEKLFLALRMWKFNSHLSRSISKDLLFEK